MPTREEPHLLVDSLPEEALKTAFDVLSRFQTWPPPSPPVPSDLETFRANYRQREKERLERLGKGRIGGFVVGGSFDPTRGVGSSSGTHWEGNTAVVTTHRHYKGQFFTVVERIHIDEDRRQLIYKHEVTCNNKTDQREIAFDLLS
jgi:hypothetical protein